MIGPLLLSYRYQPLALLSSHHLAANPHDLSSRTRVQGGVCLCVCVCVYLNATQYSGRGKGQTRGQTCTTPRGPLTLASSEGHPFRRREDLALAV